MILIYLGLNERLSSQVNYVSISGNVVSENNNPINNAIIILKLSSGSILQEKTDTIGNFLFKIKNDTISDFTINIATDNTTNTKFKSNCGFLANSDYAKGKLHSKVNFVKNFKLFEITHCGEAPKILFYKNSLKSCNDSINRVNSLYNFTFNDACDFIYETLIGNPTIVIEISGHASLQEKNPDELALYRAQQIKEILVAKGINRRRIETKGWGNQKLLVKDDVIKKAKSKIEKNALHAKNQRVVFRILNWDFKE